MTLVPTASYFRTVDDVAERLESVRTDRGWSAREFSRLAGLDEKQFQKIQERGGRRAAVDTTVHCHLTDAPVWVVWPKDW